MPDSPTFEWVAARLEAATTLSRLEARGTVRLALKQAGLDAAAVSAREMAVVVRKLLPEQLRRSGVDQGQDVCGALAPHLDAMPASESSASETPESVFRRLGGR